MNPINLAQAIPVRIRQVIYSVLGTLYGLELIFDWIDSDLENKLLAAGAVLGFAIAVPNTPTKEQ